MDSTDFEAICRAKLDNSLDLLTHKNAEYAGDNPDRLAEFKRTGADLGVGPLVVAAIHMNKHLAAVKTFIQDVENNTIRYHNESIKERLSDIINYALFMEAIIADRDANILRELPQPKKWEVPAQAEPEKSLEGYAARAARSRAEKSELAQKDSPKMYENAPQIPEDNSNWNLGVTPNGTSN